MGYYEPQRTGHYAQHRQVAVDLGLTTEDKAKKLSDNQVEKLINESGHIIFMDGDNYAILPKEYEDKLHWITR